MSGPGLEPLRAVTYRSDASRRLEDVTMRPPEIWDDDLVRRLSALRPDHVMHLLAPGSDLGTTLQRWQSAGVLDIAAASGLYGWSWQVAGRLVRGVAGAMALPVGQRLIPHERVRSDIVAARADGLARAVVQAEPIVVLHDGHPLGAPTTGPLPTTPPVELSTADERHRVWPLGTREAADVSAGLAAGPPPVVADGHHRLAALDSLAVSGSAFSHALVLVVDVGASDLSVRTIHRVVPGLDADRVATATGVSLVPVPDGAELQFLRQTGRGRLRFVLGDSARLLGLEVSVEQVHALCHLHRNLLPRWEVPEARLGYAHEWSVARTAASTAHGLAIATSAPGLPEVLEAARSGHLLPHKATSIGPKPRIGLLMLSG